MRASDHVGGAPVPSLTTQLLMGDARLVDGGRVRTRQSDYELRRAEMTRALLMARNGGVAGAPEPSGLGGSAVKRNAGEELLGSSTAGHGIPQRRHYNPTTLARSRGHESGSMFAPRAGAASTAPATPSARAPRPQRPARLGPWAYAKHKLSQIPTKYWIIFAILLVLNSRRIYGLATEVTDPQRIAARQQHSVASNSRAEAKPAAAAMSSDQAVQEEL